MGKTQTKLALLIGHSGRYVDLKSQLHRYLQSKAYRFGRKIQDHRQLRINSFILFWTQSQLCHEKNMYCIFDLFVFVFLSFFCRKCYCVAKPSGSGLLYPLKVEAFLASKAETIKPKAPHRLCVAGLHFSSEGQHFFYLSLPKDHPANVNYSLPK